MSNIAGRPELARRFYETVGVARTDDGFQVLLDGRTVRTPLRRALALPTDGLARAVADEWDRQAERVDPATMPLTRLANTVIDAIADDPQPVRDDLARFAETDLLFYRAEAPERLVERQREIWDPIVAAAETALGARFVLAQGIMHAPQPERSLAAIRERFALEHDPFRIAALHQMTTLTGSALIALALAEARLDLGAAWGAAHVDEDWNIEQWGEDGEAEARRAARLADMRAAALVVSQIRRDRQIPANQS